MTRRIANETPLCAGCWTDKFVVVAAGKRCGALQRPTCEKDGSGCRFHERHEDRFACDTGRKQLIPNPPRVDLAWTILKSFRGFDLRLQADPTGGGNARQPLTIVKCRGQEEEQQPTKKTFRSNPPTLRLRSSPSKFGVWRGFEARPERLERQPPRSLFCSGYDPASG